MLTPGLSQKIIDSKYVEGLTAEKASDNGEAYTNRIMYVNNLITLSVLRCVDSNSQYAVGIK